VRLAPVEPAVDSKTPVRKDPFRVPLEDRLGVLLGAREILARDRKFKAAEGSMDFFRTQKVFASTEGAAIEQEIWESGAGIQGPAVDGDEAQTRSYPNSHGGQWPPAVRGGGHGPGGPAERACARGPGPGGRARLPGRPHHRGLDGPQMALRSTNRAPPIELTACWATS
jgi:hypothetical protein